GAARGGKEAARALPGGLQGAGEERNGAGGEGGGGGQGGEAEGRQAEGHQAEGHQAEGHQAEGRQGATTAGQVEVRPAQDGAATLGSEDDQGPPGTRPAEGGGPAPGESASSWERASSGEKVRPTAEEGQARRRGLIDAQAQSASTSRARSKRT